MFVAACRSAIFLSQATRCAVQRLRRLRRLKALKAAREAREVDEMEGGTTSAAQQSPTKDNDTGEDENEQDESTPLLDP